MVADKWLLTVGTVAQTLFWGIGYFVGFTIVSALTLGAVVPAAFDEIGQRRHPWHSPLFRENGQWYLAADLSAIIGWLVLTLINLWFAFA